MSYIDTAEATAVIADYFDLICDTEYAFDETEILRRMNAHADNDVAKIIRCEDCIYSDIRPLTKDGTAKVLWCKDSGAYTLSKWCSRAKRKEE